MTTKKSPSRTERRWWYCQECQAINDAHDPSECWNCGWEPQTRAEIPWCEMRTKECEVCHKPHVIWVLPPNTYLTIEAELGFCPRYFEHYGENAYTVPMLPSHFVLDANGYYYNEKTQKVVKRRVRT